MQAEETSNGSLGGPAAPSPAPAEPQRLGKLAQGLEPALGVCQLSAPSAQRRRRLPPAAWQCRRLLQRSRLPPVACVTHDHLSERSRHAGRPQRPAPAAAAATCGHLQPPDAQEAAQLGRRWCPFSPAAHTPCWAHEGQSAPLMAPRTPSPAPSSSAAGSSESSSPSRRSPSTASGQLSLVAMQDADSAATCAILLPERYTIKVGRAGREGWTCICAGAHACRTRLPPVARWYGVCRQSFTAALRHLQEGSALWGGVKLGRLLGAGVQVGVHCRCHHQRSAAAAAAAAAAELGCWVTSGAQPLLLCSLAHRHAAAMHAPCLQRPINLRALAAPQAKVFELVYADGQPTGKVLKIAHTGEQDQPPQAAVPGSCWSRCR